MGTSDTAANGDTPPATDPTIYDIDGIDNPASTVAALHADGDHVICYIEVGTAGNYYSASEEGTATTYYAQFAAAGDLGDALSGYPENFLNINAASTVSIIESMIHQQCAAKGFDAVETDLDETFNGNEGTTGFTITQANEVSYLQTLATYMHSLGLGWFAKDVSDTDSTSFANAVEPFADGVIVEQCAQYDECQYLGNFQGNKLVLAAEYQAPTASECATSIADNLNMTLFDNSLDGNVRVPCQ